MTINGAIISDVTPESIAAELGLEPGDRILAINGVKPLDFIDYLFLTSDEESLTLDVLKTNGETWELELEKDASEPLGLGFSDLVFDKVRTCRNNCLFCFVHQLPENQRASLYVKDDDYRLSFLQGSYITLTNLTAKDWERIIRLRLSPLYISVHATDPTVRQRLLGRKKAADILDQLRRLTDVGITLHTQAVLCPGINDGLVLEKTITDLAEFWPNVASLAVVPVGLTGHRDKLFELRPFQKNEAKQVIDTVRKFQKKLFESFGSRFVFAADEWYIIAGEEFPPDEAYEDYLQLDNGVGLTRRFLTEFAETIQNKKNILGSISAEIVIITGRDTGWMWFNIQDAFRRIAPLIRLEILPVENYFFGQTVTVTGLLSGQDILRAVINHQSSAPAVYLIPQITLKADQDLFLDSMPFADLQERCRPKTVQIVPSDAASWIDWICLNL